MNPYSIAELVTDLSLAAQLKVGMQLDRAQTRKLLKQISQMNSDVAGCAIMQAQLQAMLEKKGWKTIIITAQSPDALRRFGVSIGYGFGSEPTTKLSAMQKEQNRLFKGRRYHS